MAEIQHSIRTVARRTGLNAHVIRVWEKRYGAVSPLRADSNHRLYSDQEIERLNLLRMAKEAGHSIGRIARLDTETLRNLTAGSPAPESDPGSEPPEPVEEFLEECISAAERLDGAALADILERAAIALGQHGLLHKVIGPLAQSIGDLWRDGTISAAHEHFASAAIRAFLQHGNRQYAAPTSAPGITVATPAGQLHELGAVMVAAAAADLGWRVTYLGTSLPAAEIAGAATQDRSRAVALSIVYPADDENLGPELDRLRRYLPSKTSILAGGRAAESYRDALRRIGAIECGSLDELYDQLERLRTTKPSKR